MAFEAFDRTLDLVASLRPLLDAIGARDADRYLQLDDARYPERQLEIYRSGDVLTYDRNHLDDEYGGLGDQPIEDDDEWAAFEITADEFETAWASARPRNTRSAP